MTRIIRILSLILVFAFVGCADALVDNDAARADAVGDAAHAEGPYIIIPFAGQVEFSVYTPGPTILKDGVLQIRSRAYTGQLTGDLPGDLMLVLDGDVNMDTGAGAAWGTFELQTESVTYSGSVSGAFSSNGQELEATLQGRVVGAGNSQRIWARIDDHGQAPESELFEVVGEVHQNNGQM